MGQPQSRPRKSTLRTSQSPPFDGQRRAVGRAAVPGGPLTQPVDLVAVLPVNNNSQYESESSPSGEIPKNALLSNCYDIWI